MATPAHRPHPEVTLPVIPPPAYVPAGPTRDLLSALYEHDWRCYPATQGQAEVVSPDHVRSLILRIVTSVGTEGETFAIHPYAEGDRVKVADAIAYIRTGSLT